MTGNHSDGQSHWLHHYGNVEKYRWRREINDGKDVFHRPLGLVEFTFDTDGRYYEGRADMNCQLEIEVKHRSTKDDYFTNVDYRERLLLSWALLRQRHSLIQSRTFKDDHNSFAPLGLHLAVSSHRTLSKAVEDAGNHIVFLQDHYDHVDHRDFHLHCLNGSRILNPSVALAKLFVLPLSDENGRSVLRLEFVFAHEISDGLSAYTWMRDMVRILNEDIATIKAEIKTFINPDVIKERLPPPQEALYSPISGSKAKQRWFWAITRILRHVRKPLPVGFDNPLKRHRLRSPVSLSPVYHKVLTYTRTPPLNTIPVYIHMCATNTQRLHRICRQAQSSIGAGIYALAALCMMEFHEERYPHIPLHSRKSFITGFPLNPRAFFNHTIEPDSMMLAFSDGIALPLLSRDLPVEGRLRLLARQAQRQLSAYQKRTRPRGEDAARQFLNSRGAGLVLANQYLYSHERADSILPENLKRGTEYLQGAYPPRGNPTNQTCGVSSVGNRDLLIKSGIYNLQDPSKDFAADFLNLNASVRAREGEFLLGIAGTNEGLFSSPSIDMTTMDPELVQSWVHRFEHALDEKENAKL